LDKEKIDALNKEMEDKDQEVEENLPAAQETPLEEQEIS
jgi:hypothetical protein